jgi:hypothetical protein
MNFIYGFLTGVVAAAVGIGYAFRAPLKSWLVRAIETRLIKE